jgi:PAS domain S-box-containing protein
MSFRRTTVELALALVILHILATATLGTRDPGVVASNLLQVAFPALAAVVCFARGRGAEDFARHFWRLLAASFALWTLGQSIYCYYVLYLHRAVPSMYPGDIPFLAFYLPLAAALFLTPPNEVQPGRDWGRTLDLAQVAIVLTTIYLYAFFFLASSAGSREAFLQIQGWFYDFADLILAASFLLGMVTMRGGERRLFGIATGFVVAYALGDGLYGLGLRYHLAHTGTWFDLGYTLPFGFVAIAAACWEPLPSGAGAPVIPTTAGFRPLPLLAPLVVLALALHIAHEQMTLAFLVMTASLLCYSARLALSQHHHKQARRALSESEEELARVFHTSPDPITVSSLENGRYLQANEAFLRFVGYSHDEVIGRSSFDLGLWANAAEREAVVSRLRRGEALRNLELSFRVRSGQERQVLFSADVLELQGERCLVAFSRDITERRQLEQQLRQAQKMEAVGRLAGGIAHDFNNLLTVISGYMEILLADPAAKGATEMREIMAAAERASALTRQLLAFSRRQLLKPQLISLNDVISGMDKLLPRLVGESIDLEIRRGRNLSAVLADPGQIEQVVMNLAVNARDAMPNGGAIFIETTDVTVDEVFTAAHAGLAPGRYATLAVRDTGVGMDKETQARIFEPFFTTKELGRGTGLGLSTVYGIVKQSGGYIQVESEPGKGATFRMYLPRHSATENAGAPAVAASAGSPN